MARILSKGMTNGKYNDLLTMEKFPHNCLITTSGYDSPDYRQRQLRFCLCHRP